MRNSEDRTERLQKVIARLGIASRRHAEQMIIDGLVKVNGQVVTELGTKVKDTDLIEVKGRKIYPAERRRFVYYLLNKPEGVITSASDPQHRKTVIDLVRSKVKERVFPVGRLDYDTRGLLLLTNDGELTYRLTHPRYKVEKTYRAKLNGYITAQALIQLENGVMLKDGLTSPAKILRVERIKKGNYLSIVELSIHEGKNRQVRRMFEAVGYPIFYLERIAFGPLLLDSKLKPGEFRPLRAEEVTALKREVGLE